MNAYVCVYRHRTPSRLEWKRTEATAVRDELLTTFLREYDDGYFDWGDDPGFFAAQHRLGDARMASWGVCRRDVRIALREGDSVVFFCASQADRVWRYYFVGVGVVATLVKRTDLWSERRFAPYRDFYNVLAKLDGGGLGSTKPSARFTGTG